MHEGTGLRTQQTHQRRGGIHSVLRPKSSVLCPNMKAARQVEAVELMVASNTITVAHVEALLKATPPEQRADVPPPVRAGA